eukprot:Gb_03699 [translate_table: standard]
MVDSLKQYFVQIQFERVPRIHNKSADAMATIGSLLEMQQNTRQSQFLVEQLMIPTYDVPESEMVCEIVGPNSPWYHDIYTYLHDHILPLDLSCKERKSFIQRASRYVILGNTLYCRGYDGTLLKCLNSEEANLAIKEVHEGICGAHTSGMVLAKKLLRTGYYWPTMEKDSCQHVRKCVACQKHGDLVHAPSQALQPITAPWPFSTWGLHLIGKINPSSSDGHKHIFTATEYFTKWVEVIPLTTVTGKQISKFILNHIICRYGIPSVIIIDNGKSFKNKEVRALCDKFHVKHKWSTPYYPQGNGQAEASNKTLIKIIKKIVNDKGRNWHLQLDPALWAYRTSIRTPTGATPYSLVFGTEAILPVEIELPSLHISL